MESIKKVLMNRDGMTAAQADQEIANAKEQLQIYLEAADFGSAEEICAEYFNLEPDYIFELM